MEDTAKEAYAIRGKMCRGINPLYEDSSAGQDPIHRVLGNYEPYCNAFHLIDIECLEEGGVELYEACPFLSRLHGSGIIKIRTEKGIVEDHYEARCNWPVRLSDDKSSSS